MAYTEINDLYERVYERFENEDLISKAEVLQMIANAPVADVVEVVRCKECVNSREMDKYEKNLYVSGCVGCTLHSASYHSVIMEGDSFCSYGERKEGAEE